MAIKKVTDEEIISKIRKLSKQDFDNLMESNDEYILYFYHRDIGEKKKKTYTLKISKTLISLSKYS